MFPASTRLVLFSLLVTFKAAPATYGFGINLINVHEENIAPAICATTLLRKYFSSSESLSGAVLAVSLTSAPLHVQQNLLRHVHSRTDVPWSVLLINPSRDQIQQHIMHEKPQSYFFVLQNMEDGDLDDIIESWKSYQHWNPLAQVFIYLAAVEESDEEMSEIMVEIFLVFMNKKIYNVNVIGQSEESTLYYAKTVFPYHPDNNCGNRVIVVETLDTCDYLEREPEKTPMNEDDDIDDDYDGIRVEPTMKEVDNFDKPNETDSSEIQDELNNDEHGNLFIENSHRSYKNSFKKAYDEQDYGDKSTLSENSSEELFSNNSNKVLKNDTTYPKLILVQQHRALFTDKFPRDLSGCTLIAAYRPWEPYIFNREERVSYEYFDENLVRNITSADTVEISDDGNYLDISMETLYGYDDEVNRADGNAAPAAMTGFEYEIVRIISEQLKISIDIQVENKNLYHLLQQLIDGEVEIIVGGIDEDPSFSQFVSSTIPYHQDDLTWCVAKAERKTSLLNFLASFNSDSWLLVLSYILTCSTIITFARKSLKLQNRQLQGYFSVCIYLFGILLNQSINLKPKSFAINFILATAFFMGVLFSNAYQSFLVSTLTTPHTAYQISHLSEIYTNRMSIMGSVDNVRHLSKDGEIFKYIREKFQMCYNIEECLNRAADDPNIAVAVSRLHSFYNPRIRRDRLYCFDRNENLYMYFVTMLLPKKFHLLHHINPIIQQIIESGHIQKWARDLDMRRKIHEEFNRARESSFKRLTLTQFNGAFLFAAGFLIDALLIFFTEQLVYWLVVKCRTRLRLVRWLHNKFAQQQKQ